MTSAAVAAAARAGRFGPYGGRYVPETLIAALDELAEAYPRITAQEAFRRELAELLASYAGRPTPLSFARRVTSDLGGAAVYLKREDLAHTGAHKINNVLGPVPARARDGQAPRDRGDRRRPARRRHGDRLRAVRPRVCRVHGRRGRRAAGARTSSAWSCWARRCEPVTSGSQTLKDATNEALRDWVTNVRGTYYCIGSVMGPHPYPTIVRDFQRVIGVEARRQILEATGRLPDVLVACVGGGSNAIGLFHPFLEDASVRLIGVEAAGEGLGTGRHGAALCAGEPGVLHGMKSLLLYDDDGQIFPAHSISAGLDYPGVGPEHAFLRDSGRAEYTAVTDAEALDAFVYLSRMEGIIPALESAHAVAHVRKLAPQLSRDAIVIVNLSGRGDKDAPQVRELLRARDPGPR